MSDFRYWRQSICDGEWTHPMKGFTVVVTPAKRRLWEANFRLLHRAGAKIPIVYNHDTTTNGLRLGFVIDVRQNGVWLEELHAYLDEAAVELALENGVSVAIHPNIIDPDNGVHHGSAITHSGITPTPVVQGQGPAVPFCKGSDK